jgi:hypothetical protein
MKCRETGKVGQTFFARSKKVGMNDLPTQPWEPADTQIPPLPKPRRQAVRRVYHRLKCRLSDRSEASCSINYLARRSKVNEPDLLTSPSSIGQAAGETLSGRLGAVRSERSPAEAYGARRALAASRTCAAHLEITSAVFFAAALTSSYCFSSMGSRTEGSVLTA